jgi:hypothetical protein
MLYKRLLSSLLSPVSFRESINHLGLDTGVTFSPAFLQSLEYLCVGNDLGNNVRNAMCVRDLMEAWVDGVDSLDLSVEEREDGRAVDDELELVYRLREKRSSREGRRRRLPKSPKSTSISKAISPAHSRSRTPPSSDRLDSSLSGKESFAFAAISTSDLKEEAFAVDLGIGAAPPASPAVPFSASDACGGALIDSNLSGYSDEDTALQWAIQESLMSAEQNARIFGPRS